MCVYDQNYALVVVTQPKKEERAIRLDEEDSVSISCSDLQNHFNFR